MHWTKSAQEIEFGLAFSIYPGHTVGTWTAHFSAITELIILLLLLTLLLFLPAHFHFNCTASFNIIISIGRMVESLAIF